MIGLLLAHGEPCARRFSPTGERPAHGRTSRGATILKEVSCYPCPSAWHPWLIWLRLCRVRLSPETQRKTRPGWGWVSESCERSVAPGALRSLQKPAPKRKAAAGVFLSNEGAAASCGAEERRERQFQG